MEINSGRINCCKLTANSGSASNKGIRTVAKTIMTITMLNMIIMYLNFNENTPIIKLYAGRIIKERKNRVNGRENRVKK